MKKNDSLTIEQCTILLRQCETQRQETKDELLDILNDPRQAENKKLAQFQEKIASLLSENHNQGRFWQPFRWKWLTWCFPFIGKGSRLRSTLLNINQSFLSKPPAIPEGLDKNAYLTQANDLFKQHDLSNALSYYNAYFEIINESPQYDDILTSWKTLKQLDEVVSERLIDEWRPINLSNLSWPQLKTLSQLTESYTNEEYVVNYFKAFSLIWGAEKEIDISPIVYKLSKAIVLTALNLDPNDGNTDNLTEDTLKIFWHRIERALTEHFELQERVQSKSGKMKQQAQENVSNKTHELLSALKSNKHESYYDLLSVFTKLKSHKVSLSSRNEEFFKVLLYHTGLFLRINQTAKFDERVLSRFPSAP